MIKMQIILDSEKIQCEGKVSASKIQQTVDDYLTGNLGLTKGTDGFYYGDGSSKDFSRFGLAFNTLRKRDWFLDNVGTWLYFNSDASDNPNDFVVEDMKDYCQNNMLVIV